MTATLVLVLTYFSVAVCSVIGSALMLLPRLLSSAASQLARGDRGRHRGPARTLAEARP